MITKKYYKLIRVNYEDEGYFYIKNESDQIGNVTLSTSGSALDAWSGVEYSTDGINWNSYDRTLSPTVFLPIGGHLYWRGNGVICSFSTSYTNRYNHFNVDVNHSIGGNIISLVDKVDFATRTSFPGVSGSINPGLYFLFGNDTKLISAEKLNFGHLSSVGAYGLQSMFSGCTMLEKGCDLSSITSIGKSGAKSMYYGCSVLTSVTTPNVTTWDGSYPDGSFYTWLQNVSASGTIYAPTGSDIANTSGSSGVPSNWTVVYY